jgi:hypothetical protein
MKLRNKEKARNVNKNQKKEDILVGSRNLERNQERQLEQL